MSDASTRPEATHANSSTGRQRQIAALLVLETKADVLDEDLTEYKCPNCSERCINPTDSTPAREGVCVECLAWRLATGSTRDRLIQRTHRTCGGDV